MAVTIKIMVFWFVTPGSSKTVWRFGGTNNQANHEQKQAVRLFPHTKEAR
jgi:hypothetical protein